jgi:hypothetical protein
MDIFTGKHGRMSVGNGWRLVHMPSWADEQGGEMFYEVESGTGTVELKPSATLQWNV